MEAKLLVILAAMVTLSILEAIAAISLKLKDLPLKDRIVRGLFNFIFGYIVAVIWWLG